MYIYVGTVAHKKGPSLPQIVPVIPSWKRNGAPARKVLSSGLPLAQKSLAHEPIRPPLGRRPPFFQSPIAQAQPAKPAGTWSLESADTTILLRHTHPSPARSTADFITVLPRNERSHRQETLAPFPGAEKKRTETSHLVLGPFSSDFLCPFSPASWPLDHSSKRR